MSSSRLIFGCLTSGLSQFLVGLCFHFLAPIVAPDVTAHFDNEALFRPWSGWTSRYMIAHPFGYGFVFAITYYGLHSWGAFPSGWRGGLAFGGCLFLVGSLPVFLLAHASFAVPSEVIVLWLLQSFCQYVLAGVLVGVVAGMANREIAPADGA